MLKRRALLAAFALVLTLGLGGCDDEFCNDRDPHPLTALFRGLHCMPDAS